MKRWQAALRAALLLGSSLGLAGCPVVLSDDFSIAPAGSAATGGADHGAVNMTGGTPPGHAGEASAAAGQTTGSATSTGGMGTVDPEAGASGSSVAGAPTLDPCAACSAAECCNGQCVDLLSNPNHCRECNHGCPGTTCDSSSCTNICAQPFLDCNQNVVDGCEVNPAIDPKNCGNCGIECGFQLECVAGYCVCPAGTADCDGFRDNGCEIDTSSDNANCGGCGKPCGPNQMCSGGVCDCRPGFDDCNSAANDGCEADLTAPGTCGECGLDCGIHGVCELGGRCDCAANYLDCDAAVAGCETPITDPNHCGNCETACPAVTPVCDGGTCQNGCAGLMRCQDSCVDTDVDPENCGGCGELVGLNQICVAGQPQCAAGYDDCDDDPKDCETNTQTDSLHCSACGAACKAGAICDAGSCICAPSTPNDCGSSCEQCCDDSQCSDGDSCTVDSCDDGVCAPAGQECASGGNCCAGTGCFECCGNDDCPQGRMCSNNQCVTLTCTQPQILCNLKCVNTSNDAANCGGCGNSCGPGRSCSNASCTPKWVSTAAAPVGFAPRERAAYAAMGSKVFIWGGNDASAQALDDGVIYDPATDGWTIVPAAGSPPSARVLATAVWTGSVVVVWGGGDAASTSDYASGSRYDPVNGSWQAMSMVGAPPGRRAAYGFWTGSRVLFYSGWTFQDTPATSLYLYDPVNDVWASTSTNNRPSAQLDPTVSWTGTMLIRYGGRVGGTTTDDTYTYTPASDAWDRVADGPSSRSAAFGTWDGAYHLVWSGISAGGNLRGDGRLYEPIDDDWTNLATASDPEYRRAPHRQSGWSARIKPRLTLMVGGTSTGSGFRTDGGLYNSTTNQWTPIGAWPSSASHLWGVGIWTGTEFVVWGGRLASGSALSAAGERYLP